jgi:hypothetical protein
MNEVNQQRPANTPGPDCAAPAGSFRVGFTSIEENAVMLFSRKYRPSQRRAAASKVVRPRRGQLWLEALEARETPTVDAFVFGTQLNIVCFNDAVNTVKVDHSSATGRALISGTGLTAQFNDTDYDRIAIWGGDLGTTTTILANVRDLTVVDAHEGDVVNIGGDDLWSTPNSVQKIGGNLTIAAKDGVHNIVNVYDNQDDGFRTATLRRVYSAGSEYQQLIDLAPRQMLFEAASTRELNIHTSQGGTNVKVESTSALPFNGVITLFGHNDPTLGGTDTVYVSNAGSVQGVRGILTIQNPPDYTAITIDDSGDSTFRTVTLDTYVGVDGRPYGTITGLAALGTINYKFADTSSVTVHTGTAGATVNVLATGVATTLVGHGLSTDTVNVGYSYNGVQGIQGSVTVLNAASDSTLNISNAGDSANHTVMESVAGGMAHLSGLAPAMINFRGSDVNALSIITGSGLTIINGLSSFYSGPWAWQPPTYATIGGAIIFGTP